MTTPAKIDWIIANVADSSAAGCDLVRQWLREHNWAANPVYMEKLQQESHQARPLVLLATVDSHVVAGLFAETQFAWLRLSIMAVVPEWRSQGIGAALLAEAERIATARSCNHVYVETMEYQAPRFYLAHGFAVVGELRDWDSRGHTKFFLTKCLDDSNFGRRP
jgi:GNAT superfamily N-acetyltransferase